MINTPVTTADLLRLTQWLSPAFPVGGYSYSHGLEWSVAAGEITDRAGFEAWLRACLTLGAGRNDAILLGLGHSGDDALPDLRATAAALAASRERWQESLAQGRAFERLAGAIQQNEAQDLPLPLAVGLRVRALDLPRETVLALYLQNFASNLCTIATRMIPLGQTDGQIVLNALGADIDRLAQDLSRATVNDLASGALRADLAATHHETQEVRLYQS